MPPTELLVAKLQAAGIHVPPGRLLVESFGDSPGLSQKLIERIRSGHKRAATGLLWAMEEDGDPMPQAGDIEIVVDHMQEPVLLIRVTRVEFLPFDAVTADYAATEGEGDGSLEYWREGHWRFFSRACARIRREPSLDMPVVCTVFELLASMMPRSTP
jgi:uncharacterized protein YhfF